MLWKFWINLQLLYCNRFQKYYRSVYGNNGNCKDADFSTPYSIANTDEYPNLFGAVLTLGTSISF